MLSPAQLVEIHTSFIKFDVDGDGHINPKEIRTVMRDVGVKLTADEIKQLIASVDADGNGMIEFDEFVSILASNMLREGRGDAELDEAFAVLDRDGSGMLDLSFVRDQLTNLGSHPLSREECDSLLSEVDGVDDDGRVSMRAFKAMPCWKVPNSKQMQQAEARSRAGSSSDGRLITVGNNNSVRSMKKTHTSSSLGEKPARAGRIRSNSGDSTPDT